MSGKSGRGQGKRSARGKKRKGRRDYSATVAQHQIASPAREPAIPPKISSPAAGVPTTTTARPTSIRYPYVGAELRRIGILAGIMVVILIVLALVLS